MSTNPFSHKWWTDHPGDSHAYTYSDPNVEYDRDYFDSEHHPSERVAQELYSYMQQSYKEITGRYFKSVLELGSGGGELALQFNEDNLDFLTIEGSSFGVEKLISKGIERRYIIQTDVRLLNFLYEKFDLVVCTEIAEHIEPWFASKVVENCVNHSDFVWFSAANAEMNPHYHHPNVAPIEAWDNIFKLFGFSYKILDNRHDRAARLYYA